jgi:hypothetical protein
MPRGHLVAREQSLSQNDACTALCGAEIQHVDLLYFWDETQMGTLLVAPRGICSKCAAILPSLEGPKLYVYGVGERKRLNAEVPDGN